MMRNEDGTVRKARVIQLNAVASNSIMHVLLNDPCFDFDIALVQDPWWGPVGQTPLVHSIDMHPYYTVTSPQWHCFVPTNPQNKNGPGVAIYTRKGRPWLKAEVSANPLPSHSLLALDFTIYGFKTRIINVYLHGSSARKGLTELTDHPLDQAVPTIIAGDFNLHHELWSHTDYNIPSASKDAQTLADWILEYKLEIMNKHNVITRLGKTGQHSSIIDLTIVNHSGKTGGEIKEGGTQITRKHHYE
ncbi:hypothetical protein FRC06_002958 [Ceratobasidium sp. 370]|nr:hypothetical protein FRC06_002958 [Ceratobasidium sp. 370]